MDRTTLAKLLERGGEAESACREAVLAGADFTISDGETPVGDLRSIYARREEHIRALGIPSVGFAEAVRNLEACELDRVLLGGVMCTRPPYWFAVFLSPDRSRVVACLGVSQDPVHRSKDLPADAPHRPT
ncbi:hypothetical protein [Nonomuraea thailandensis]|uniref:hypothetical protein n=1 Tax=Nonomuraea thailandensis TaxID=1188745 RepID=UPI0031EADC23